MRTIAFVNRRGGVAKTASAFSIASGIHRSGKKVLMIDLDAQGNLTFNAGIRQTGAYEMLTGVLPVTDVIRETTEGKIIPSSPLLSTADITMTGKGKEYRLQRALEPVSKDFDYCIIDTPPNLGTIAINALTASQGIIVPVQAEAHSLQAVSQLYGTIQAVRKRTNPDLQILGILITRFKGRTILARDMRENLREAAEHMHTKVFTTEIRECSAIPESESCQKSIFEYAPRSNAAHDYQEIVNELLTGE